MLDRSSIDPAAALAFGINTDTVTVTRAEAMKVGAVKRGRAVIAGVLSSLPLVELDAGGRPVADPPAWLEQPDPNVTLSHIITWTVDDLLFHGVSWWRVTGRYANGWPASFERLAPERVMVVAGTEPGAPGGVYVDGRLAPDADLRRFDGPDEGLLRTGANAIRTSLELEAATRRLAKLDVPLGYLTPEDSAQELDTTPGSAGLLNPDGTPDEETSEVDELLDTWDEARTTRNTAYLNRAIKYVQTQLDATKIQLTEQRQAQAVEIARHMNLEPRYVAAPTGDSSTYATVEGNRRELLDVSLAPYILPLEQRLSMGDTTPRGRRVRLRRTAWMRGDLHSVMQAAKLGHELGAVTEDEIRTEYLGLPPRSDA